MARRGILVIGGGLAIAAMLTAASFAQKAPDPLVGTWTVTGHNVHECVISYPSGTLEVGAPPQPGGDYPVRVRQSWRSVALPGCPEPESTGETTDLQGAIRRQGNRVALVVRNAEGQVLGPWGYEIEGNSLRFICEPCVKTNFRWVRRSGEAAGPRR